MHRRILALICAFLLLAAPGLSAANIDYTLFGEGIHQNLPAESDFFLTYNEEKYSLLDDCACFDEALSIYGGKTRAVYEYTLPQGSFSAEDDGSELLLGCMTIDIPYRAQLTVLEGNRRSGEYTVIESCELTDVYVDEILLPRGENGAPVLVDRIYLYSYEVAGETKRMAATLYFDYEGFTAGYTVSGTASEAIESSVEAPTHSVAYLMLIPVLVCLALLMTILHRRRSAHAPAKTAPKAVEPAAPVAGENLSRGEELLRQIQAEDLRIGDSEVSERVEKVENICAQMLATVAEQPSKASQLRRFLNYYLPTTLKMLTFLRTVRRRGVSKSEVDKVRASTLHGLDMVLAACQKQLDNLYRDGMLDLSTDIEVLEQMLERDGLAESGLDRLRNSRSNSGKAE